MDLPFCLAVEGEQFLTIFFPKVSVSLVEPPSAIQATLCFGGEGAREENGGDCETVAVLWVVWVRELRSVIV